MRDMQTASVAQCIYFIDWFWLQDLAGGSGGGDRGGVIVKRKRSTIALAWLWCSCTRTVLLFSGVCYACCSFVFVLCVLKVLATLFFLFLVCAARAHIAKALRCL